MSSNPSYSNYPHDMPLENDSHNKDVFFSNNGYDGFDSALPSGQADSFGAGWDVQADRMAHVPDASSLGWQASTDSAMTQPNQALSRPASNSNNLFQDSSAVPNARLAAFNQASIDPSFISPATLNNNNNSNNINSNSNFAPRPAHAPANVNASSGSTIAPGALQTRPTPLAAALPAQETQQLRSLSAILPKGTPTGPFLITSLESLKQKATVRNLSAFVSVGNEPVQLTVSSSNIPSYNPRQSRNQIRQLLASNQGFTASVSKKSSKKAGAIRPISVAARLDASGKLSTQTARPGDDASSDDSTDDSEYESSEGEPESPPIPAARPTDAQGAIRYDSIKALWRPSNQPVSSESIRDGIGSFWDILKTIRERWKSDQSNVADAEKANKTNEVPLLKERVKNQRDLFAVALKAAIEHGHPGILDNFSQVLPAMNALALFLQDRSKESDYNSAFPKTLLDFLSRCTNLDNSTMSKTSVDRMLERFSKRGDDTVKALAKRITNNAAAASKKTKDVKSGVTTAPLKAASDLPKKDVLGSNGIKRSYSGDSTTEQSTKRLAGEGSPASKQAASTVKKPVHGAATSAKAAPATASASSITKPKTNQVYAKPSSFISSLQSAKKPTAATAVPKPVTVAKPTAEKKIPEKKPAAPAFSFASVMADMSKPQEKKPSEPKAEKQEIHPPETPKEKATRLRKEARRKLRVTFAPEGSLEDIRYFHHDPDEETGHDFAQTRDVGDVESEGKMFRHLHSHQLEIDEDEDADMAGGDPFIRQWKEPALIDFSVLPNDIKEINYAPYGGGVQLPDSPEKVEQEKREANSLMVVYTDDADIPPTPKEPVGSEEEEDANKPVEFGVPSDKTLARAEEAKRAANAQPKSKVLSDDITAILGRLQQNPATAQPAQAPAAPAPMATNLTQIINSLPASLSQRPGQAPAFPMLQPPQQQPAAPSPDLQSILAAMGQKAQPAPQPAPPPAYQAPDPVANKAPDLQALLSSLSHTFASQGQAGNQLPATASVPGNDAAAAVQGLQAAASMPWMQQPSNMEQMAKVTQMWNSLSGGQQQGSSGPGESSALYENADRKRFRESSGEEDGNGAKNKQRKVVPGYKTVQCRYWFEGKCRKGDDCTYKHGEE